MRIKIDNLKIYLGIIAILVIIFVQTNKYEADFGKKSLKKNDTIKADTIGEEESKYSFRYSEIDTEMKVEL